jgi:hypothetical protein
MEAIFVSMCFLDHSCHNQLGHSYMLTRRGGIKPTNIRKPKTKISSRLLAIPVAIVYHAKIRLWKVRPMRALVEATLARAR